MGLFDILLIAIGLSMDAFAVSVCKGLSMNRVDWRQAAVIALFFGVFQAGMPLLGYFLGVQFSPYVEPVDHWIAFLLLSVIGGKLLWDGIRNEDSLGENDEGAHGGALDFRELLMLAIATSIDAFAVGCSFAFMSVDIWRAAAVIGLVTFALSVTGVALGNRFGARYNRAATIAGGVALVLIGVKTVLEHLGVLGI